MYNFISRGSKSGTRGRLPRDVKQNALDNLIWHGPCNMQQILVTRPLLLLLFESQQSAPSLKFASRASIFDACQNHCTLDKNLEISRFHTFQKRSPSTENNRFEAFAWQGEQPCNGEVAPPGGAHPRPTLLLIPLTKCSFRASDLHVGKLILALQKQ